MAPLRSAKPSPVAELRRTLIINGYSPVPVVTGDKMPKISGWSKLKPDLDQVGSLLAAHPDHLSTGLLCGDLVAIDVDVIDPTASSEMLDLIAALPGAEHTLSREGQAPKTLFLFRASEAREKATTPVYLIDGKPSQVELMGIGQQVVAFGTHPSGKEYEWLGDSPLDIPFADLPLITPDTLDQFLGDATAVLARHGTPKKKAASTRPTSGGDTFWRRVNNAALANIPVWVPAVFSTASEESGTGAWRVKSADLGRSLQEDISIHPDGIHDFGEETAETPISLVQKWGSASSAKDAALWLCERLGIDPISLGWETAPGRPFAYGRNDCSIFLADWWHRVHGVDPASGLRGRYSDENSKDALVAQERGLQRLVARLARSVGARRKRQPSTGDFGLIVHAGKPYGAICTGRVGDNLCWAIRSEMGVAFLTNPRILQAWAINVDLEMA